MALVKEYRHGENDQLYFGDNMDNRLMAMVRKYRHLLLLFSLLFSGASVAGEDPDVLLRNLTSDIMDQLLLEEEALQTDPAHVDQVARILVDEFIVPHIDMQLMSRWIIGKSWRRATPQQRQQFIDEFTGMLIRTYASALVEFRDKTMTFKPFHHDPKRRDAVVRAEFIGGDGAPAMPILFRVKRDKSGNWKVIDIIIDGVSLVKNYRSQFGAEIRKVGLDGLIRRLSTHNRDDSKEHERGALDSVVSEEG